MSIESNWQAHRTKRCKSRAVDVLVIGAGHAGLAVSANLTRLGIDHLVFERGEVAQRWRSERWDSLKLLTPNWMCQLPGYDYEGDDPDGFMTKDQLADVIAGYARRTRAPVVTNIEVSMVTMWGDGYRVVTNQGEWWCRVVVNATGAFANAAVPTISAGVPIDIHQITAKDYRNPEQLPEGGVLIVGASATGLQLAEEIQRSGRQVTLAVGEHVRMPRTWRGRDVYWWLTNTGLIDEGYQDLDDIQRARGVPSPQLVGRHGEDLDLNALQQIGVQVTGRFVGFTGGKGQFSGSLANHCKSADLKLGRMLRRFDEWAEESGVDVEPQERPMATTLGAPKMEVDFRRGEVKTVVWATGFKPDYSWLKLPVYDRKGAIKHDGGVVVVPGVYTLGLTLMRSRKSSFIYGANDDSGFVANHIREHLDYVVANERVLA